MAKKSRAARRRRTRRILFGLELVILVILVLGLLVYSQINKRLGNINIKSDSEDDREIEINEEMLNSKSMSGYTNLALFGVDGREGVEGDRSDTTIIASINNDTKEIKLVSVYRDTYLDIGNEVYDKSNAAYGRGGAKAAISMLNTNLDLDITKYVSVDFKALSVAIDCLDGVDVPLTYQEMVYVNDYSKETSKVTGIDYDPLTLPDPVPEDQTKVVDTFHLNGVQATSYCRIRYTTGWDMKRTERQRQIISLIVQKAKKASPSQLLKITDKVFPLITTNIDKDEMIKMGMGMLSYKMEKTTGFPYLCEMGEPVKNAIGLDCIVPTTLEVNVRILHDFLFAEGGYEMSETVLKRSDYIAGHTGFGEEYVPDDHKHYITDRVSTYDPSTDPIPKHQSQSEEDSYEESYDDSYDNSYSDSYSDGSYDNSYNDNNYNDNNYNDNYSDGSYDDNYYNDSSDDSGDEYY